MKPNKLHIIPLEPFLRQLMDEGLPLGVAEWLRVAELLEHCAVRGDEKETIKHKLGALLAKDEEQQAQVYRLFDSYWAQELAASIKKSPPKPKNRWQKHKYRILFGLLVAAISSVSVYLFISTQILGVEADFKIAFRAENMEVRVFAAPIVKQFPPFFMDEVAEQRWEWSDGTIEQGDGSSNFVRPKVFETFDAENRANLRVTYRVKTKRGHTHEMLREVNVGLPHIAYIRSSIEPQNTLLAAPVLTEFSPSIISIESEENDLIQRYEISEEQKKIWYEELFKDRLKAIPTSNNKFRWEFGDGSISRDSSAMHRYRDGFYEVLAFARMPIRIKDSLHFVTSQASTRFTLPQRASLPPVPFPTYEVQKPDIEHLVIEKAFNPWPLYIAVLILLLYGLYELLRYLRLRPVLDELSERGPPLKQHLKVDEPGLDYFDTDAFNQTATALRARQLSDEQALDVPASVKASLEQGGLVDFKYRMLSQASQYLVLIDQRNKRDHLARLQTAWVRELEHRDITADFYYYDCDPSLCWKDRNKASTQISINQLQASFTGYKLIIFGDGEALLDKYQGQWMEWADILKEWPFAALLSSKPSSLWGREEANIAKHISLLPDTEYGLSQLVNSWEAETPVRPQYWIDTAYESHVPDPEHPDFIADLKRYLGSKRFRWLCACARYPNIYHALTQQLGIRLNPGDVSVDSLSHLFRLPWFRDGDIPDEMRIKLLNELDEEGHRLTREYLIEVLEQKQNEAAQNSYAEHDRQITLAIYKFLNSDQSWEDKEELRRNVPPEEIEDMVSLRSLADIQANPLAIELPRSFYRGRIPVMGTKWQARLFMMLLAILLFLGICWWKGAFMSNVDIQEPYQLSDLKLSTAQDSMEWQRYQAHLLYETGKYESSIAWSNPRYYPGLWPMQLSLQDPILQDFMRLQLIGNRQRYLNNEFARVARHWSEDGRDLKNIDSTNASEVAKTLLQDIYFQQGIALLQQENATALDDSVLNFLDHDYFQRDTTNAYKRVDTLIARENLLAHLAALQLGRNNAPRNTLYDKIGYKPPPPPPAYKLLQGYLAWTMEPRIPVNDMTVAVDRLKGGRSSISKSGNTGFFSVRIDSTWLGDSMRLDVAGFAPKMVAIPALERDTLALDSILLRFEAKPTEMELVEGDTFMMGTAESEPDGNDWEKPAHQVAVSDFYMDVHEVTVAQYMYFVQESGHRVPDWLSNQSIFQPKDDDELFFSYKDLGKSLYHPQSPITGISWEDAKVYTEWLSQSTSLSYQLPTETQWEFAARGGNLSQGYRYAGSNVIEEVAWYYANSLNRLQPVRSLKANELGLYDMSGNVWEWCADRWHENYQNAPSDGSSWEDGESTLRVIRGGSWVNVALYLRVSDRSNGNPDSRYFHIGFRLTRTP